MHAYTTNFNLRKIKFHENTVETLTIIFNHYVNKCGKYRNISKMVRGFEPIRWSKIDITAEISTPTQLSSFLNLTLTRQKIDEYSKNGRIREKSRPSTAQTFNDYLTCAFISAK